MRENGSVSRNCARESALSEVGHSPGLVQGRVAALVAAQCQPVAQPRAGSAASWNRQSHQSQEPGRSRELLVRGVVDLANKTLAIAATFDRIVFCLDLTNRKEGHNGQNNRDRRA
jgi:hypothetical protein